MDEEEIRVAREKLLAGTHHGGDGRPVAKPGLENLWLHAQGARITGISPRDDGSMVIGLDFTGAAGWWQPGAADREELPGGLPHLGFDFAWAGGAGYFGGTLWAFWTWMNEETPVDVYAAEGAWTLLVAPSVPYRFGTVRSAMFPTILPPESPLNPPPMPEAEQVKPGREAFGEWLEANSAVAVTLGIADEAGGTSYVRQWAVPKSRAEDFAGMMTHRFGKPGEMVVDLNAARENMEGEILMTGDGFCECGEQEP